MCQCITAKLYRNACVCSVTMVWASHKLRYYLIQHVLGCLICTQTIGKLSASTHMVVLAARAHTHTHTHNWRQEISCTNPEMSVRNFTSRGHHPFMYVFHAQVNHSPREDQAKTDGFPTFPERINGILRPNLLQVRSEAYPATGATSWLTPPKTSIAAKATAWEPGNMRSASSGSKITPTLQGIHS